MQKILSLAICLISVAQAQTPRATSEANRRYALETVAFLRPSDNIDGILNQTFRQELESYFATQTRFTLRDISQTDAAIAKSKLPYTRVVQDRQLLTQMARSLSAEGLVRTQIQSVGNQYIVTMEWIHAPDMDSLGSQTFKLNSEQASLSSSLKVELRSALDQLFSQVPFKGQVTGRDGTTVTVNLGRGAGISSGDVLVISSLEEAKRHPVLKKLVGWDLREIGRVRVDDVEERMLFATVLSEDPANPISRYTKVTKILPQAAPKPLADLGGTQAAVAEDLGESQPIPRIGWLSGTAWGGSLGRSVSQSGAATASYEGGGLVFGARANGHVWLTRDIFLEAGFHFGISPYGQRDATGTVSLITGTSTVSRLQIVGGYNYRLTRDLFGPMIYGKIGGSSMNYGTPFSAAELAGSSSFSGLVLGVGTDVPLFEVWGFQFDLTFGIFQGAGQPELLATVGPSGGGSDVQLYFGGYYKLSRNTLIRAGFDFFSNSTLADTGFTQTRVGHSAWAFAPAVVYLF